MDDLLLQKLGKDVQRFVKDVEESSKIEIKVEFDSAYPLNLAVSVECNKAVIYAHPDYNFSDGAIFHEVSHVKRFLIDQVPRISLTDDIDRDDTLTKQLTIVDNLLEHLIIVPIEIEKYPERKQYWDKQFSRNWCYIASEYNKFDAHLHWAFLNIVLPQSKTFYQAKSILTENSSFDSANQFASNITSLLSSKEDIVGYLFREFPELPKSSACLEYLDPIWGGRIEPIPD
jgi:hypothetical protein